MRYLVLILFFLSCSKKNYQENFISNDEVIFSLNKILINDAVIFEETKKSIEIYKKDCGFKPDYVSLFLDKEMDLSLIKYQDSENEKISDIKEELKFARGVTLIDKVPVIIYFTKRNDSLFIIKKKKLIINFKSSNIGCYFKRYYEFENGKLKLDNEYFISNIR